MLLVGPPDRERVRFLQRSANFDNWPQTFDNKVLRAEARCKSLPEFFKHRQLYVSLYAKFTPR